MITEDKDKERQTILDGFGEALSKDLNEAIEWRAPYEQRWIDAERQLKDGRTWLSGVKEQGGSMRSPTEVPEHQRATDNITAPITAKTVARVNDMLFRTDEGQFDIEPSPKATPSSLAEPPDPADPNAAALFADAIDKASESMEKTIKDYLSEADYSKHGRAVVKDSCQVGTGVMHGPFPKLVTEKIGTTMLAADGTPVTQFVYEKKTVPSVERLDFRRFYPRPARNMEECEGVFILDMMTRKKLEKLKEDPTYDAAQIDRILEDETGPKPSPLFTSPTMSASGEMTPTLKGKYPVWKYVGPVDAKCVCAMSGAEAKEGAKVDAEVHMCQGIVIKVEPRDGEDRLPFQVANHKKDPDSIFGWGVPHVLANDQFDVNLSWGYMKLNAVASAMPIVGVITELLDPEQGAIDYPPRKIIKFTGGDIAKAIQVMPIPSTSQAITEIYDRAKVNANNHADVQSMEEAAPANVQVGAAVLAMLKIEQNVITADAAVTWDDSITKPLIQSFIDFELAFGKDKANKGAFDVVPKAASHLLTKDIQAQQAMQMLAMSDNPANTPFFKRYELVKTVVSRTDLNTDQIMNTQDEAAAIEAQQAQQPNPEMMKLEVQERIETLKAQTDLEIAKIKAQSDQYVAQMSLEAASIKAASDETKSAEEAAVRERIAVVTADSRAWAESLKDQREREATASKTTIDAEKIAQQEAKVQIELANETPFRTQ